MNQFQKILEQAKLIFEENKAIQQRIDLEKQQENLKKEEEIFNKRENKVTNYNYETDCYSKELLGLIKQFGFIIESYDKFTDFSEYDYEPTLETYYCKFNQWRFEVHNYSDVDIKEGIFALNNIKHITTGEEVDFYCDLGCRNTGEDRLDEVLEFLSYNSLQGYVNEKYKNYVLLPSLLRNEGYSVEEVDYNFKLNEPQGYLKLNDSLFVKVYRAWHSDFKFVITNDKNWNVNSANDSLHNWGKKAYFFNYNSINDISELCKCIEAFKEEQAGKIGYYENGQYYGNNDIIRLYDNLRDKENPYKDCWNHYLIQVEHKKYWDCRGYDEDNSVITNKYKGLEIYITTELTFNERSWKIGDYANKSIITFEYDKRKNPDKCRLLIDNYIYNDKEESWQIYDDVAEEYIPNKSKLVGSIEMYGTFTELYNQLKDYIYKMCEIHEIQL